MSRLRIPVPFETTPSLDDSSEPPPITTPAPGRTNREGRLDALKQLEAIQCGVVRRDQLRSLGWTRQQIQHEITFRRWHQPAAEVIALQNSRLTGDQLLWLGVLHAGPGSVLSHATTLRINGLKNWEPVAIDVLSPKSHTLEPLDGFFFHETRRDYHTWVHSSRRPPQLRVEQACLLTAERKRSARVGIGLAAACVQQRMTTSQRLLTASMTISKLRHGHQIRLALLDIAGGAQSFAEIDLGRICREFGLQQPSRQAFRYDAHGRRRYLDCSWELGSATVVLEIDGSFHLESETWWQDMKRERELVLAVGKVLRCSTYEIRNHAADLVQDLVAAGVPRA